MPLASQIKGSDMGAFNELLIFRTCPCCGQVAELRLQVHAAASFDFQGTQRLCNREYRLGQRLSWWPKGDMNYPDWKMGLGLREISEGVFSESCLGSCGSCGRELECEVLIDDFVIIGIENLRCDG
jgi:hypothetical protein